MGDFKKLYVWKKSKAIAVSIYSLTNQTDLKNDYGLVNQMRRAAISILSNIAEGDESGSIPNAVRYFRIAVGSCAELISQLIIAKEIYSLEGDRCTQLEMDLNKVSVGLKKLIRSRMIK